MYILLKKRVIVSPTDSSESSEISNIKNNFTTLGSAVVLHFSAFEFIYVLHINENLY